MQGNDPEFVGGGRPVIGFETDLAGRRAGENSEASQLNDPNPRSGESVVQASEREGESPEIRGFVRSSPDTAGSETAKGENSEAHLSEVVASCENGFLFQEGSGKGDEGGAGEEG